CQQHGHWPRLTF
nr:immunoglobulin light chain junction region [Macaca mulatta]